MKTAKHETVAILGISDKPERYSYKAAKMLRDHGHTNLLGITPKKIELDGVKIFQSLAQIDQQVHTLTVYVGPALLTPLIDDIVKLHPSRIILNPGTENPLLEERATKAGIKVERACTLVLLSTDQF